MISRPDIDPSARTAIWGISGSGKSYLSRQFAAEWATWRCVVVIDPTGDDPKALPAGFKARPSLTQLSPPTPEACLEVLMQCYLLSTKGAPVTVICDEAPFYLAKLAPATLKLFNQGRHRGLGIVLLGQRPSAVAPDARANCSRTLYMRLMDRADLNIVSANSRQLAAELPNLKVGEFRQWPPE